MGVVTQDENQEAELPDGVETELQMARISSGLFEGVAEPARLGRFVVLERLGHGAMGTVVRAYDPQLDRSVAIKVLRTQARERDPSAQARMAREARTLAKLNHPNVVAVHEVGTTDDQMFLAMEMVDGGDLARWLAEHPDPQERFVEALELLSQAGRGLAAAHEAGVVHRDFKPANVLIGTDGRVRVADFGLARFSAAPELLESRESEGNPRDSASVTQTGAVVGTPAYMAPEQREGRPADALADQYAFCVTAWEALFGTRPSAGTELEPPSNQSTRARSVAAVLRRGLSSDRIARHADMQALLEGFTLNPIQRRRRVALGALGVFGVAAVVAGYGIERSSRCDEVALAADEVWSAERRSQIEQGFLAIDWAGAERSWQRFAGDADAYVGEWKTAAQESCRAGLIDETLDEETYRARVDCFDDRMVRFDAVLEVYAEPTRELVVSPFSLARALGPVKACVDRPGPVSEEARPLMRELARGLGVLKTGQDAEGLQILRGVVADAQEEGLPLVEAHARAALGAGLLRVEGPQSASSMEEEAYWMALEHGDDVLAAQLAGSLAQSLAGTRDVDAAERWLKPATALAARVDIGLDDRAELETAKARVAYARGDLETASEHFEESLRLAVEAWGPEHPEIVVNENNLANSLRLVGELDRAVRLAEHALGIRREYFGDLHPSVARSHQTLGSVLGMHQRPSEAAEHFERAVAILTETYGREHRNVASGLTSLGQATQALGDEKKAEEYYREALEIFEALGESGDLVLTARMNLGRTLFSNGRCGEAVEVLESVVEGARERSEKDPRLALARWMLGASLVRLGRAEEAAPHLEAARSVFAGRANEEAGILVVLARMHRVAGDTQAGLDQVRQALALLEGAGADPAAKAEALTVSAWLHLDLLDEERALSEARQALELYRGVQQPPALWIGGWGEACQVLLAGGAHEAAKVAALEAHARIDTPQVAPTLAPALTADVYLVLAASTAGLDPEASRSWAGKAVSALSDTDETYASQRALARRLSE